MWCFLDNVVSLERGVRLIIEILVEITRPDTIHLVDTIVQNSTFEILGALRMEEKLSAI